MSSEKDLMPTSEIENPSPEIILPRVIYRDDGALIPYAKAWDEQFVLLNEVKERKKNIRSAQIDTNMPEARTQLIAHQRHYLWFCEHPPVFTLGKSGSVEHLLYSESELAERNATFFKINRGGDITFHGPGQITGYPIFDMECFFTDVHKYVRSLEEIAIRTLSEYGLVGIRIKDYTGVWIADENTTIQKRRFRKICAIGVHLSRWVTMHGFAFNVNTDLSYFDYIIPCGINEADKSVTSLAVELNRRIDMQEVKNKMKKHFKSVFSFEFSDSEHL